MIPYYILAIEDETDRAYMTALFFQYQKLMYSTIQKVTNDHWLIDDIFQMSKQCPVPLRLCTMPRRDSSARKAALVY